MAKRDIIAEIEEIRRRHRAGSDLFRTYNARSALICDAVAYLRSCRPRRRSVINELYKYVPIGSVACMEHFYRSWVARLIDHGEPFLKRIGNYRQVRFDHEAVLALHARRVSLGEYVAHQLSINSLADINEALSPLVMVSESDRDFLAKVGDHEFRVPDFPETFTIAGSLPGAYSDVAETFRLRHIYCHEIAVRAKPLTHQRVRDLYISSLILVFASDLFLESLRRDRPGR